MTQKITIRREQIEKALTNDEYSPRCSDCSLSLHIPKSFEIDVKEENEGVSFTKDSGLEINKKFHGNLEMKEFEGFRDEAYKQAKPFLEKGWGIMYRFVYNGPLGRLTTLVIGKNKEIFNYECAKHGKDCNGVHCGEGARPIYDKPTLPEEIDLQYTIDVNDVATKLNQLIRFHQWFHSEGGGGC